MTDRLVSFARWYSNLGAVQKVTVSAVYWFALLWFGAVIEREVQKFSTEVGWPTKPSYAAALFACILILAALQYYTRLALTAAAHEDQEHLETLMYAKSLADQLISGRVRQFADAMRVSTEHHDLTRAIEALFANQGDLERIVKAVYQLFESRYGDSKRAFNRIDFEVTFMTNSYHDGEITIPAYANRVGRAPRSLLQRKDNPQIYSATVTALCYKDSRPRMRVVEDTLSSGDYSELYSGQKARIRSSVVFPVLSHLNELLGTLVVHCDRPRFFRERDSEFWAEVLEVFSAHLALEKTRLDFLHKSEAVSRFLSVPPPDVPF